MENTNDLYMKVGKVVVDGLQYYIGLRNIGALTKSELLNISENAFIDKKLLEKICVAYENEIQS